MKTSSSTRFIQHYLPANRRINSSMRKENKYSLRTHMSFGSAGFTKDRLDDFVLNIEFLLISVIQGVALSVLAQNASSILGNFSYEYILYVVSGFLIIIFFWAQAIMHTISFIDWPLDMTHNFLYFLIGFFEIIALSYMTSPYAWFLFLVLFSLSAAVLYVFDYMLIRRHKNDFSKNSAKKALYDHIEKRQKGELLTLIPLSLFFNILCVMLIMKWPGIFLTQKHHLILIGLQVLSMILVLFNLLDAFAVRTRLITAIIEK